MNNIIKIEVNENQEQLVAGRELHTFLEIGTQYSKWFERMRDYGFVENTDYVAISQKRLTAQGNETEFIDHAIKLEMAKEIAMIQRSEKGKQARQYFIKVEKKFKQQTLNTQALSPQLQLLINIELEQKQIKQDVADNKKEIQGIRDIVALNPNSWRNDSTRLIQSMARKFDDPKHNQDLRRESYKLLEERMGCNLSIRLTNKKQKMALEGTSKSKIDKLNKLDVIADDKKLIEGYVAIVKEMAIKYGISNTLN